MNAVNDLINFICAKSKISSDEICLDTEIYDSGIVSSLSILEMVTFIENRYGIIILPEELTEDNFRNISTIAKFIGRKKERDTVHVS